MSFKPNLYDQYPITVLPRIPDLKLNKKLVISNSCIDKSIIDLGISKSSIASYLTKPSPKLIWSHSLNPSTIVNALDSQLINNESEKLYLISSTDRAHENLQLIKAKIQDLSIQSVDQTEYNFSTKCVDLKILNSNTFLLIFSNGAIEFMKFDNNELKLINGNNETKDTLLYSTFINDMNNEKELVLTVCESQNKKNLNYRLYSIDENLHSIIELHSSSKKIIHNVEFAYISGILYQYHQGSIESLTISNFESLKRVTISSLIKHIDDLVSIKAPASDRLLLSYSNSIYLLSFKFETVLAHFISSSSSLDPIPDQTYLCSVAQVKGNSQSTQTSNALYLNLKNKDNNVYLNSIDLNVGLNKLDECLGKSISKIQTNDKFKKIPDIFELSVNENRQDGDNELNEIYDHLKKSMESKDINKWESILIPYLKNNKTWEEIRKTKNSNVSPSKKKDNANKVYSFKEFEVDVDRIVDISFIDSILNLIFQIGKDEIITFKDIDFVPEYTLMYLLTNPLFPQRYSSKLIELLNGTNLKVLLRQTINTCPNISCKELVQQLFISENDEEMLIDLINRIVTDFNHQETLHNIKQVIKLNSTTIDIIKLISRLLSLNSSDEKKWYMIEILIDVNGLFTFNNQDENLDNLIDIVDSKLKLLELNSLNLTLFNQISVKNERNVNKNYIHDQLESIQSSDHTQGKNRKSINKEHDSRFVKLNNERIPAYSIETIEIK